MTSEKIAIIGAGGKTTALKLLAKQNEERSVLVTTTTHIYPIEPPQCRVCLSDPTPEALVSALSKPGIVCAGSTSKDGKLGMIPKEALERAVEAADIVIYEADGSRHHPLKLHQSYEPVVLRNTSRCLVVAGLSAFGRPAEDAIHRYALSELWKKHPGWIVGKEELLYCVLETVQASGVPLNKIRIFLNQADVLTDKKIAQDLADMLQVQGYQVRWGSLQTDEIDLSDWVRN